MEELTNKLLYWYKINQRSLPWRETKDPYCIWISEIMLQQTRVEAVKEYYKRFIEVLPTLEELERISEDRLLKLWEGLGYYSRVRNMQKTAKILVEKGNTNLPDTLEELLCLPGIGSYTAGAILSIAYDIPTIAIDGNVYRVLGRCYQIEDAIGSTTTYKKYAEKMQKIMPKEKPGDFIQSFMDLGSSICLPKKPKCVECPLKTLCKAHLNHKETLYPVKQKKKKQRVEERTIFLLIYNNKVAIQKRNHTGLLASMYEFPNTLDNMHEIDVENLLQEKNISYKYVKEIGESKHVFSHIIWYMRGIVIFLNQEIEGIIFVTKEELQNKYSIPSAFSFFLEELKDLL